MSKRKMKGERRTENMVHFLTKRNRDNEIKNKLKRRQGGDKREKIARVYTKECSILGSAL